MRKLFALTLVSYLLAFSFPFVVMATHGGTDQLEGESDCDYDGSNCDEETTDTTTTTVEIAPTGLDQFCPFTDASDNTQGFTAQIDTSAEDQAAERQKADDSFEEWSTQQAEYIAKNGIKEDTCGEPNSFLSGLYLEKGDCSAAGKVITEISEVIAPDVVLDEDNQIVTVYAGLCCLYRITDTNGKFISCEETVTFYAKDYSTCSENLASCEKRQWVIGSSGIGIVKLMVKQIFTFGVLMVGAVAVATIVFQGIKISVSGVSGDITESKNKILQAIAGIVLLFLSGLILYAINPTFFG